MNTDIKFKILINLFGILFLITPIFLPPTLREYEVEQKGQIVEVIIVSIPDNCRSTRWHPKVSFEYKSKVYHRGTGWGICDRQVGDKFLMKHLDKYEHIFLYPKERIVYQFIAIGGMSLFGLYALIYMNVPHFLPSWMKEKKRQYKRLTKEELINRYLAHRKNFPKKKKNKA